MLKCFPSPLFQVLPETQGQGGEGKGKKVEGVGKQVARGEGRGDAGSPRERRGRQGEGELQEAGEDSCHQLQSVPFSSWQQPMLQQMS